MRSEDVVVVGAGPFGLSISAHLSHLGVGHTLVGRPMATWREHMPAGMNLRSEPYGSDLASPRPGYDVRGYSRRHDLDYVHRLGPLPLGRFLDYSQWYVDELVQPALDVEVTGLRRTGDGFVVELDGQEERTAAQVVLAVGLLPFQVMPEELADLPGDLVTHVSAHHDLGGFAGRRVAVIGGGQSALETLALLHEAGADATLVMRKPAISWLDPNPEELGPLGHVRRPCNKLCEGWHCQFWYTPALFRRLPQEMRIHKARSVLGPAGAWWLEDRVEGVVETLTGHRIRTAVAHGSGVRLVLDGPRVDTLDVDHVIAATGFRVDVDRLGFLDAGLHRAIATEDGYPVLDRAGRSGVDGLWFAGAAAAGSLGPSMRFIAGTHRSASVLARRVAAGSTRARAPRPATTVEIA